LNYSLVFGFDFGQEFYLPFYPEIAFVRPAKVLRQVFYFLVPLLFLEKIWREYYFYFPAFLWLSAMVAWTLHRIVGSVPLRVEMIVLTLLASVFALVDIELDHLISGSLSVHAAYWALGAGLAYFATLAGVELRRFQLDEHPVRLALLVAGFYVCGVVLDVSFVLFGSAALSCALVAAYFAVIASGHSVFSTGAWIDHSFLGRCGIAQPSAR
jgi:hypothetical protein